MTEPSLYSQYSFFLGGYDLEMVTIAELLSAHVSSENIFDKQLTWGAKASAYQQELEDVAKQERVAILIELESDISLPKNSILVNHHNERAGQDQPTAIEQIFKLLNLPTTDWNRWFALVSANDRGYIPELLSINATTEEIQQIRQADRRAQGITPQEEQESITAIEQAKTRCNNQLTVVVSPHDRTSPIADRMEKALGGVGFENLLICGPTECTFFGRGDVITKLKEQFPKSWCGGALPKQGFWGGKVNHKDVLSIIEDFFNQ